MRLVLFAFAIWFCAGAYAADSVGVPRVGVLLPETLIGRWSKSLVVGYVLSELRRPRPEPRVVAFVAAQPLDSLFVSTVTLAEIRFGIELVSEANRRARLNDWLTHKVRPMFEHRVLPVSEEVLFKWRLLVEAGRKAGHTFSQPDLFIAATGLHHGLTVVSRDTADHEKARVPLFNPWTDTTLEDDSRSKAPKTKPGHRR